MKDKIEIKISNNPVEYNDALTLMENRVNNIFNNNDKELIWLLEHPPIYTAGTNSKDSDLLNQSDIPLIKTGRGGKITYHGPGQRVAYLMLDLKTKKPPLQKDLRLYVKSLENLIINTLKELGVNSFIREDRIGVWVNNNGKEEKIAAIGIRIRKWITFHGIAININPNLDDYKNIVPCGISQFGVTSLKQLGIEVSMKEFDKIFLNQANKLFV